MDNQNFRKTIINDITPYFKQDKRYYLLVGDMGFGAIDQIKAEMSDRVFNFGIMEQGAVGIAAGMAMSGLIPIVYSMPNFLVFRAIEQIRNDVMLHNLNVKFIATGANNYFRFLGNSHCCGADDSAIINLIGLKLYDPYNDSRPFEEMVSEFMKSERAGYMRV